MTGRFPCGLAKDLSVVNPSLLLIMVVMFGAMFMMTRSAKKKQAQAADMRNKMEPGSGVRTIGGMYALVKAVNDDSVELEVAPGVHAIYAKNAIAVVMDGVEYNRIVHGDSPEDDELELDGEASAESAEAVPADQAEAPIVLDKTAAADKPADTVVVETEEKIETAEPAADKGVTAK